MGGECDETSEKQIFELVPGGSGSSDSDYELHVGIEKDLCLVVSTTSHRPGPGAPPMVMARRLFLSECDAVSVEYKTWTISPTIPKTTLSSTMAPTIAVTEAPVLVGSMASSTTDVPTMTPSAAQKSDSSVFFPK